MRFRFSSNKKILIFNVTGDRNVDDMLNFIHQNIKMDEALFTPNISSIDRQATGEMKKIAIYSTFDHNNYLISLHRQYLHICSAQPINGKLEILVEFIVGK